MATHDAIFHFHGDLVVRSDALGFRQTFERDQRQVTLQIPARPDSLYGKTDALRIAVHRGSEAAAWDEGRVEAATVNLYEVAIELDIDLSTTELTREQHLDELKRGQAALHEVAPTAISVAADFISWVRVQNGRFWLPPGHERPEVRGGWLLERSTGRRVRNIGYAPGHVSWAWSPDAWVTSGQLDQVLDRLKAAVTPPLSDALLADARRTTSGPSADGDARRGILLAAVASELKIKDTLRTKTPAERRDLVDIILANHREIPIGIAVLTHPTMKAAVGRSLHDEKPDLFKAIGKLFEARNHIVHRGKTPTLAEAHKHVRAAVDLFAWLDSL